MSAELQISRRPSLQVYLRLGRVSNLPTVWTNCITGMILAGGEPAGLRLGLSLVALSMLYVAGMFLNDAFDHNFDRQFRKERPIPSGEISLGAVYTIGFGLLVLGEILLTMAPVIESGHFSVELAVWALLLPFLIVYYNYRHKRDPLSPLIMALCRLMVYMASAAVVATALTRNVMEGGAVLTAYMIGLTYVAKQENLKEVRNLWPLLFLAAPFVYGAPVLLQANAGSIAYLLLAGVTAFALSLLLASGKRNIPKAVVTLIAGIALVDGILVAGIPGHAEWALVGIAGLGVTLFFQRYISGT